ncbi:MAG: hypothetical protein ACYTGV_08750 [Planctomycetota bacterium]|jgi:hypothetical protein
MRLRGALLVLLIAAQATAQNAPRALFDPPDPGIFQGRNAHPGALDRYTESLALMRKEIARKPSDPFLLERARALLAPLGRELLLTPRIRTALMASQGLSDNERAKLRGLLGHLIIAEAQNEVTWVRRPGGRISERSWSVKAKMMAVEADGHLRAAISADPEDVRSREDLIQALEIIGLDTKKAEIKKLRMEAIALRLRRETAKAVIVDLSREVEELRARATELELRETGPDHERAAELRKRALVLEFCSNTIPFTYEATVYASVSLLAPEQMVQENLTRSYRKQSGEVDSVPANYNAPKPLERMRIVEELASDGSACAAAALLALLRRGDPLAALAMEGMARADHPVVRTHLPRLLEIVLRSPAHADFAFGAQRHLVRLAGLLKLEEAAPLLASELARDDNLDWPKGVADALALIGRPQDAEILLALALDRRHDIYFRREAAYALGRFAPGRLEALEEEPLLEIAVAAALLRTMPTDEALKGRILAGLDREHEADEAARYCADLGIREGLPMMETFLDENRKHYAAPSVRRELERLRRSPPG